MMDPANSKSMQSNSSGGDHDQEYDPNFLQPFSDFRDPVFFNWPVSGSDDVAAVVGGPSSSTATSAQPPPPPPPPAKNPKKRTRASRRAPTTVLTTDTSNFRAMVQEFTGVPAPPFTATSAYSRLLGPPFRPAAQRTTLPTPPQLPNNLFSSSSLLLNMGGQTQTPQAQLLGSGQQPGQPDPILALQSQLLQQQRQRQQQQPPPGGNVAFGDIGNDGSINSTYNNK